VDGRQYAGTELAVHGGLDLLLARRGPLTAGETAMVVMAVGRALAALHAAGRVHGSVTTGTVLVDAGMRPRVDASRCRPTPSTEQECARLATEDVRALGALAVACLGGDVPPALRVVLSAAIDPMASLRPSAVELVRMVLAAVPPEGLRLTGHQEGVATPPPRRSAAAALRSRLSRQVLRDGAAEPPGRRRHAGPRRRSGLASAGLGPVTLLVALALIAAAVGAGTVWARASEGDEAAPAPASRHATATPVELAAPTAADRPTSPDWSVVVQELDVARSAAFADADPTVLSGVDAPGSPALASDLLAVRALAVGHVQARGYTLASAAVQLVSASAGDAVVTITDTRSAYQLVDASGVVVASQPARAARTWLVHLVDVDGTWLVREAHKA